ncbi:MAG TPA: aldose epimerase family protein [Candidatus Acidoferrum sp.]|nr:aldose epimerase family protein [Candidatus Acidoferrum sp.]
MKRLVWTTIAGAILMGTLTANSAVAKSGTTKSSWGKTPDGAEVELYTLTNKSGMEVAITTYGGAVVSLKAPDRHGTLEDVVLGYDSLEGYVNDKVYFGAIIGRYANRIGHAQFTLDGKTYTLAKNNGENTLHGGIKGFNKAVWTAKEIPARDGQALELTYLSKDGEEGFPGNLHVRVVYTLTDSNELKIEYLATTDKDTVVNLTNHSYFNLLGVGPGTGDVLGHVLMIEADKFTPVDSGLIPTGELRDVAGTPFDFRKPTAIGVRINDNNEQLKLAGGYDHNFVLRRKMGEPISLAGRVVEPASGRILEVWTTEPGMQLYTGNFLDGSIHGKGGVVYTKHMAFCLETQHFPDSPNHPKFPTTELKPGERYHTTTIYKFSVQKMKEVILHKPASR